MEPRMSSRVGPASGYQSLVASHHPSTTAYAGSQGLIDDHRYDSVDLDRDAFDRVLGPAPAKAHISGRPALGSRLLSSLSGANPAAAALTRSRSIIHSRAQSLASFVPSFGPASEKTVSTTNRIFGDLFNGESAPVRLGIPPTSPTKEKSESEFIMEYRPSLTERPAAGGRRRSNAPFSPPQSHAKTGWFGRKASGVSSPSAAAVTDDILNLNVNNSLFPNGPADPLSPHAFNDLLLNATGLLERMQTAYRQKIAYIASIQPEIEAQREEVEEAETRAQHLKLQLEDMGRRAQEQQTSMHQLAMQLAEEKTKAHEASEAAARTVRHVRQSPDARPEVDDDDDETPRRRKRGSAGSASDSGFESDLDRDTDSMLSGGPATPLTPSGPASTPLFDQQDWQQRQTEHHEVERLRSLRTPGSIGGGVRRMGGGEAAYATVYQLRGENHALRKQMEEMQRTLQGCIDFVGNVQL